MSGGLIKETRKLARLAIPIVDKLDPSSPVFNALIDGTDGQIRNWRISGNNYCFTGEPLSGDGDSLTIMVRNSRSPTIIEIDNQSPNHELWFVNNADVPSGLRQLSGKMNELQIRSEIRDLRLTLEKLSK